MNFNVEKIIHLFRILLEGGGSSRLASSLRYQTISSKVGREIEIAKKLIGDVELTWETAWLLPVCIWDYLSSYLSGLSLYDSVTIGKSVKIRTALVPGELSQADFEIFRETSKNSQRIHFCWASFNYKSKWLCSSYVLPDCERQCREILCHQESS